LGEIETKLKRGEKLSFYEKAQLEEFEKKLGIHDNPNESLLKVVDEIKVKYS
jgi:hypothetical protein